MRSCAKPGDYLIRLRGESVALIKLLCEGSLQTVQRVKASPAGHAAVGDVFGEISGIPSGEKI